jgi:hypothetical protein
VAERLAGLDAEALMAATFEFPVPSAIAEGR